ncbi:MAG: DNA adenine methylase [Myxococcales bacterium]|nr:DNA adenine methylase [Myxococcales bacterium]
MRGPKQAAAGGALRERTDRAMANARKRLGVEPGDLVEKTIWASPAGKKRIAERLAAMLPAHKTYVEPFAGSGAVFFAKEAVATEVLNDADLEIADAYRLLKKLTAKDLDRLRKLPWVGDEKTFKGLLDVEPQDNVERLHRFLYLTHFSYGKMRGRSFSPSVVGVEAKTIKRIEQFAPRLRNVKVYGGDYERVVRQYDSKDTAFFLDPPYPGYNVEVGESDFDEERFFEVLRSLKGKFLITYGIRGAFPALAKQTGWWMKRIRTPRTISSMRGVGGSSVLTQLLVANYEPTLKHWAGEVDLEDVSPPSVAGASRPAGATFAATSALVKGLDPNDERFVLGIVLEPEVVDAQGDIYSVEEVRAAAHRFLEEFGGIGLMHQLRVNDQVKILESYLAPADFSLGGISVRRGTWLLAVRVLSDELWTRIKEGELTGLSIGGTARRVPEPQPGTGAEMSAPAAPPPVPPPPVPDPPEAPERSQEAP